jgi:hypothetical protein
VRAYRFTRRYESLSAALAALVEQALDQADREEQQAEEPTDRRS